MFKRSLLFLLLLLQSSFIYATDYYIHATQGSDNSSGISIDSPWQTLGKVKSLKLRAGDRLLLAEGEVFKGSLELASIRGIANNPISISTYKAKKNTVFKRASINAKGHLAGIILTDSSYVDISNISISANGGGLIKKPQALSALRRFKLMRVGILVMAVKKGHYGHINIDNVSVKNIYFNESDVKRSYKETTTAMGKEEYGFGIRYFSFKNTKLSHVSITNSMISNVSHTGLKYHGNNKSISRVFISDNKVFDTGGPGIQMSGVVNSRVQYNEVNGSGSIKDSRNWARGSGMWTWGSQDIIIEHNKFLNANGPADSAGFHIDFNSDNIIFQYNLSANNAGGFIEILGNNHNNSYRYNISVNDGHRVKKKGVASQEGKIFWLSGFVGSETIGKKRKPRKRHGPYNSYIYNNTIFVNDEITAKMAVTRVARGAVVANNIFHIMGDSTRVLGDQYVPENSKDKVGLDNFIFKNNLFLKQGNWPAKVLVQDSDPVYGDAKFVDPGGLNIADYRPTNTELIKDKGIEIPKISGDKLGLIVDLKVNKDILGNDIVGKPDMGAIEITDTATGKLKQKPNIIYILADDMGYGDVGVYGQSKIKTPNIDTLAGEGMRFTQHYAGATVCGPSRASLLTGFHGGHSPIRGNPKWTNSGKPVDLKSEDITLAEMLKSSGYNTAAVGKWGLSETKGDNWLESMPLQQGFDNFYGLRGHLDAHYYYWHRLFENNQPFELEENDYMNNKGIYTHDLFTAKAIDYIKQQNSEKPFFLYLAYTIPHLALTVPKDSKKQYLDLGWPKRKMNTEGHYRNDSEGNTTYAGMVSRMDRDIGELLKVLKQQGLDANTLVIFTSDNGHEYDKGFFDSNGPLRGQKRDLYEGGIRVPFIARWPDKIEANTTSDHVSAFWDMMPTFCDLSGVRQCPESDGVSMEKTFLGQEGQAGHDFLYWEFNERRGPLQAIRKGDWKLVKRFKRPIELYDLSKDIAENHNVASGHSQVVAELSEKMSSARTYHPEFTLKKLPNPYKKK